MIVANENARSEEAVLDGVTVARLRMLFRIAGAPVCASIVVKLRATDADIVHLHLPNPIVRCWPTSPRVIADV